MNMAVRERIVSRYRSSGGYEFVKRGLDVVISFLGLLFGWPFFLFMALFILLDSPGAGPFFVQERVGKDGVPFQMVKFRTMVPGAQEQRDGLWEQNEMDGPVFKMRRDPRVTRFGRFLRKYSLDELPQLYNVLRGDMSLVGPRPGLPEEAAQYDELARQRLTVLPGMTCYWQILPNRNQISFAQWMTLDRKYLRERSLMTDLWILLATVKAVLGGNGV